ncbi:transposase, partial [Bacillus sp. DJP31]|uniref:transposase n=1 Tax=Bacillus sp. DJP31 TaxID=3409789 RepID=UPI003BB5AF19
MPLLDYIKKVGLSHLLEELLSVRKSGGIYPLSQVSLALILGRLLGKERISHLEDIEDEIMLKRFFGWRKLPDYTTYYNELKRFQQKEDLIGFSETNQVLTQRILANQERVILDFDSSVNTVYGHQKGAEVGFNSSNPGKKSFHPLYVF